MDVLDVGNQCGRLRRQQGQRSANGTTINAAKTVKPTPSDAVNGRKLQQASEEAVGTASYYGDEHYSGTYYMGSAEVFWGTFYATNQATGERWEEEGEVPCCDIASPAVRSYVSLHALSLHALCACSPPAPGATVAIIPRAAESRSSGRLSSLMPCLC